MALLRTAWTQEEQVAYVMALRNIRTGWTEGLRRDYLSWWNSGRSSRHPDTVVQWFTDAGIGINNGSSFRGFLNHALEDAKASMTPDQVAAMGDLTKVEPATTIAKSGVKARELSKISIMPPGLLNTFTEDEVLDLLAFLESMGDPKHPDFNK
jgi:hypothetical protein